MDKAFIGAREKEGAVVIQGGQYEFTGGIGVVQILSMNFMGIDKDNPKGEAQTRPLGDETCAGALCSRQG